MTQTERNLLIWLGVLTGVLLLAISLLSIQVMIQHYEITQLQTGQSRMAEVLLQMFHTNPGSQSL